MNIPVIQLRKNDTIRTDPDGRYGGQAHGITGIVTDIRADEYHAAHPLRVEFTDDTGNSYDHRDLILIKCDEFKHI